GPGAPSRRPQRAAGGGGGPRGACQGCRRWRSTRPRLEARRSGRTRAGGLRRWRRRAAGAQAARAR
ncbi:unnamed protein product, partial [Prorocentrum cordatum]